MEYEADPDCFARFHDRPRLLEVFQTALRVLLDQAKKELNPNEGDITMFFVLDVPNLPPQSVPVIVAKSSQAQQGAANKNRTIGVCQLIENPADPDGSALNTISPTTSVRGYLARFEHQGLDASAHVTVIKNPAHGVLNDESDPGDPGYRYLPTAGYLGKDSATLLVEMKGFKVTVQYFFRVLEGPLIGDTKDLYKELCRKGLWRISSDSPQSPIDLTSLQRDIALSALLADVSQTLTGFTNLDGAAVAQTNNPQ